MMADTGLLLALGLILPAIVGVIAYYTKTLDRASAVVGAVMGYIIIFGQGLNWFLIFLAFFIAGNVATKYKYKEKSKYGVSQKRRNIENVIGNGLVAIVFALFGHIYGFFAAIATATADTLSSEIGVLSSEEPVSVLDFKTRVKRGVNGGVSNLGNAFMFIGAGLIGLLGLILFHSWTLFWLSLWGGSFGCIVDSVLGATLENKGVLDNSEVNLIATLAGGLFAVLLSFLIMPGM